MMQVIQKDKIQMLVLNEGEEIIVSTSNKSTGYVSIYNDGKIMHIEDVNKNEYTTPYIERQMARHEKAINRAKKQHERYLKSKEEKKKDEKKD